MNDKSPRKNQKIYGTIPSHTYKDAVESSLSQNFSDSVRLGVVLRYNGALLSQLLRENGCSTERFFREKIVPQIQENLLAWLGNYRPRSEAYSNFEAKMSDRLFVKFQKLSQEEMEFAVKDTAVCIKNLDKIEEAIKNKDLDQTAKLLAENIVKMYLKGGSW